MSNLVYSTGDYFAVLTIASPPAGTRGAGFSTIRFDIMARVLPGTGRVITGFGGTLAAISNGRECPLARLFAPTPHVLSSGPDDYQTSIQLAADLSPLSIRALDELRAAGGATELRLDVHAVLHSGRVGASLATRGSPAIAVTLDAETWSRLRGELGCGLPAPGTTWDAALAAYYRLATRTLEAGVVEAAAFFVGAASERLMEVTATALGGALNSTVWEKAVKNRSTEAKVSAVMSCLEMSKKLDKAETDGLAATATIYRLERNEVGHPKGSLPDVAWDVVEARVREFPRFVDRLLAAAKVVNS